MDITLDKKSSTEASVKIKVSEADYQPKVEEKIKDYRKKVSLKGFRPGKVPSTLIKKMYGKSILVEEINHILAHAITDYIRENKINALGEPIPDREKSEQIDWDNQKEFEFDYHIGFVEDFDYDLSENKKVTAYQIEVDEKVIKETIENLQKQFGQSENPETSQAGDILYGSVKIEGEETVLEDISLDINDINEDLQSQFIDAKKEDTLKFDIKKAFKTDETVAKTLKKDLEEAKQINGEVEFSVKNINRTVPSELNQELFDKVFGKEAVSSEEEFRNKIKESISENYQKETENLLARDIKNNFVEQTKMELPEEFLKNWLKLTNEKLTDEDLEKEFPLYLQDLKWSLITGKIAEDNAIKVENDEVIAKTKEMINAQFGSMGLGEQMEEQLNAFADSYLKEKNGENYRTMFNQIMNDKIINLIKEKISIESESVDVKKFTEIATKAA
ncbi:trigger factor [Xanthovirga aplysinae]|uniref:trigger factor n=1 Tax=Xanthovirga aplysinae TaxID=2529853 RepID=UPI0012BB7AF8|nr:trigger factor [Xanthovirga aplysinae]MTI32214.1 trigger factor [Xanthovirga aplysinae]